jgi:hypothetical protein
MQRVWPLSFRLVRSLAIWRRFRSCCTERSIFLVLPIWHFSFPLVGTVQSFVLLYHPTISPVTRFLSTHRPFVSKLYWNTLIDKNILAFSHPNHGFDRGEYMHDMVFYLHRRFLVFLVSQLSYRVNERGICRVSIA